MDTFDERGLPMVLNLHPKCANPSCAAAFDWMAGGKLFRLYRTSGRLASVTDQQSNGADWRGIGHFWLCEHCSNVYTLRYDQKRGVVIQPLRLELAPAHNDMLLRAS